MEERERANKLDCATNNHSCIKAGHQSTLSQAIQMRNEIEKSKSPFLGELIDQN